MSRIPPLPKVFTTVLVKLKIKKSTAVQPKLSPEDVKRQAELLYFDILPSAWNVKEKKFPFQCYSIRAAKLCIDVLKEYGNYSFLEDVEDACTRWLRTRYHNITVGHKFCNPYTAFLVFLVELCVRLKKLHRDWKKVSCLPPERRFQNLMLTCLSYCFQLPLMKNVNQTNCAIQILRKLAHEPDTRMDAVINYLDTHNREKPLEMTAQVATFFRTQICLVITKLQSFDTIRSSKKKFRIKL